MSVIQMQIRVKQQRDGTGAEWWIGETSVDGGREWSPVKGKVPAETTRRGEMKFTSRDEAVAFLKKVQANFAKFQIVTLSVEEVV